MVLSRFFSKSKPIVFLSLVGYLSIHFWVHAFQASAQLGLIDVSKYVVLLLLFFGVNFIVKRNKLNRKNAYAALFFSLLCTTFPEFYLDLNYLFAAFFVILALRRLISLKTQMETKKKIFDSALWFFVACLFQPFLLPLVLLVFLGVIQYTLYDAKNLFIPIIAWACGGLFVTAFYLWKTDEFVLFYQTYSAFGWNDFKQIWQSHAVAICILIPFTLFVFVLISKVINKAQLSLKTSLFILILAFVFMLTGWAFSAQNHAAGLGIAFIPLSMLAASSIEIKMKPIIKETVFWLLLVVSLLSFL
jgi:hypothetical protein